MKSKFLNTLLFLILRIAIIISLLFASGCDQLSKLTDGTSFKKTDLLEAVKKSGELIVLTRNAPTTYYEGRDGPDGYEYHLVELFAKSLNVRTSYKTMNSVDEIFAAVKNGQGHIGAAGITRTGEREKIYNFGPDYKSIEQQIVCHRMGPAPKNKEDLADLSILLVHGTSYVENMERLKADISGLVWNTTSELSTEQVLAKVWRREVDCTLADSNIIAINQRYYPELKVALAASETQYLAWVLPDNSVKFQKALEKWFENIKANNVLAEIEERYYGHTEIFDYVDIRAYKRRIINRLPKYRQLFHAAAKKHNIPWTTLSAQSYQESHWDARAKSPTGVRGMMMLTKKTAESLGITSRLDPQESINGGAKYLAQLLKRIPEDVQKDDKLWFALAAYNVGMGHLWDARTLARQFGKDPGKWVDIQDVFPHLSQKKFYKKLKYGYARGTEPVRYVNRIRNYQDILEKELSLTKELAEYGEKEK